MNLDQKVEELFAALLAQTEDYTVSEYEQDRLRDVARAIVEGNDA